MYGDNHNQYESTLLDEYDGHLAIESFRIAMEVSKNRDRHDMKERRMYLGSDIV